MARGGGGTDCILGGLPSLRVQGGVNEKPRGERSRFGGGREEWLTGMGITVVEQG
jgi:hypothetical protein